MTSDLADLPDTIMKAIRTTGSAAICCNAKIPKRSLLLSPQAMNLAIPMTRCPQIARIRKSLGVLPESGIWFQTRAQAAAEKT